MFAGAGRVAAIADELAGEPQLLCFATISSTGSACAGHAAAMPKRRETGAAQFGRHVHGRSSRGRARAGG